MPTRRTITAGLLAATAAMLSSCGTIIYPDRVNQKDRGGLDPAVIILDAVGLFFFLIPGVVAFAVDFATGSIFLPADKEPGDKERTIFDDLSMHTFPVRKPSQQDIEQIICRHTGIKVDLTRGEIRAVQLDHLNQFWLAHAHLA